MSELQCPMCGEDTEPGERCECEETDYDVEIGSLFDEVTEDES